MKSPRLMMVYAVFLVACGVVAYFMAPTGSNPATALVVSSATAAIMVICAAMAGALNRNRTVGMIGIHAGLVLPVIFGALFAYRAVSTFQGAQNKRYLAVILTIMAAGSVLAFLAILMTRPKLADRAG
jgi:hypothetical protein